MFVCVLFLFLVLHPHVLFDCVLGIFSARWRGSSIRGLSQTTYCTAVVYSTVTPPRAGSMAFHYFQRTRWVRPFAFALVEIVLSHLFTIMWHSNPRRVCLFLRCCRTTGLQVCADRRHDGAAEQRHAPNRQQPRHHGVRSRNYYIAYSMMQYQVEHNGTRAAATVRVSGCVSPG